MSGLKVKIKLKTSGRGLWTEVAKNVRVKSLVVEEDWGRGELKLFFNRQDWDVMRDGLIYLDPTFLRLLREAMKKMGLTGGVDYTEQGMQGDDYVSFDVSPQFLNKWNKKMKNKPKGFFNTDL